MRLLSHIPDGSQKLFCLLPSHLPHSAHISLSLSTAIVSVLPGHKYFLSGTVRFQLFILLSNGVYQKGDIVGWVFVAM